MVEYCWFGYSFAYAILSVGVLIVAFPVYLCLIGSTHEQTVIANGQMPITPGRLFFRPTTRRSSSARAAPRANRSVGCCSTASSWPR